MADEIRNINGSDDMYPSAVTSRDSSQRPDIDRVSALLEASEARGDAAQEEAERLRKENTSLNSAVERSARLLTVLRTDYDRLKQESLKNTSENSVAVAETVRLRSQIAELEREVERLNERADDSDSKFVAEKKKSAALERVCMDLRRKVALAEEKAENGKRVREANLARELAEAQLAEIKVEAERWRAKSSVAEVARERAEASERTERVQREKVAALERELESRETLLRQVALERKKLQAYMSKYERELEDKEAKLAKLRGWIKERGFKQKKIRYRDRTEIELERALESDNETEWTDIELSVEKENIDDNDITVSVTIHCSFFSGAFWQTHRHVLKLTMHLLFLARSSSRSGTES